MLKIMFYLWVVFLLELYFVGLDFKIFKPNI
ncbi:hypothetical protein HPOKI673_00035 [Helicobacter pylori oki673]|nr:hypothetical protein HPSAT_07760 [Helicobacter pylori Sat464]AHN38398.1 hypothetical protein HPOKI154_00035 [Helicobacter pylori oki154]AHN41305.1 hypothetical protein HPOKI673_00035 [Helicobacter pylori oki673]AHN42742.1 hypothetical protein HPOKI828_00035 [Helicobacter pylori oki828]